MPTSAPAAATAYDTAAYQQLYRYAEDIRQLLKHGASAGSEVDPAGESRDPVTSLPTWDSLVARGQSIAARRAGARSLLLVLNVHGLRRINNALGHDVGDQVLRQIADRLKTVIHADDLVARFESDEFVILSRMTASQAEASIARVLTPVVLGEHEIGVGLSMGGAYLADGDADVLASFRKACIALCFARNYGLQRICLYAAAMESQYSRESIAIEADLWHAVERGEFYLVYQPQIDARGGGGLEGVEALLRWQHPVLGKIPPSQFIPIAEKSGALVSIGAWVLRQACLQLRDWHANGLDSMSVAVNVSPRQLRSSSFIDTLKRVLRESGIAPGSLELEITESEIMSSFDVVKDILVQVRNLGVRIAIDDFGTGHSSLARLKDLPINRLKIDESLIRDIETDPKAQAVVSCVMGLGLAMGVDVVAEGVECYGQLEQLKRYDCHFVQGFLFGRPIPPKDFYPDAFRRWAQESAGGLIEPVIHEQERTAPL